MLVTFLKCLYDFFIFLQVSGDSWMYPYQRTPMGNPYISPISTMGALLGVYPIVRPLKVILLGKVFVGEKNGHKFSTPLWNHSPKRSQDLRNRMPCGAKSASMLSRSVFFKQESYESRRMEVWLKNKQQQFLLHQLIFHSFV